MLFLLPGRHRQIGTEHRLYDDLFSYYNPESRPVENASKPVLVNFGIALNQLLDLVSAGRRPGVHILAQWFRAFYFKSELNNYHEY